MPVEVTCHHCGERFSKPTKEYNQGQKRGGRHFCNRACFNQSRRRTVRLECLECGTDVERAPSMVLSKVFCGRPCATSYNNRQKPKRVAAVLPPCSACDQPVTTRRRKFCGACWDARKLGQLTLGALVRRRRSRSAARRSIADHARRVFLRDHPDPFCAVCGYKKHVETAHRKEVAQFNDDALVSEINDPANLIGLCPTHHWEFDHNMLDEPADLLRPEVGVVGLEPTVHGTKNRCLTSLATPL